MFNNLTPYRYKESFQNECLQLQNLPSCLYITGVCSWLNRALLRQINQHLASIGGIYSCHIKHRTRFCFMSQVLSRHLTGIEKP